MLARHVAAALPARVISLACAKYPFLAAASCRFASSSNNAQRPVGAIQEHDIVLLRRVGKTQELLSKPLKHGRKLQSHFGSIDESDIIGANYLDHVTSSTREAVRIHAPTLAEYVLMTPRRVTPVYPDDANLIVSLLDIHVSPAQTTAHAQADSRFDILEAGTGHGSLTLHLARAIHAANPPPPPPTALATSQEEDASALPHWKTRRRAIVHTVDRSAEFSAAAQLIVSGFQRGLYAGNVDFHVGDVTAFINTRAQAGQQQMFSHIVLDLPDAHEHLEAATRALRDDGVLLVFCPSVTQVARCVAAVRENALLLSLSQVLELGPGLTGGRRWDVRAAKLRTPADTAVALPSSTTPNTSIWNRARAFVAKLFGAESTNVKQPERWEMVCRPSVGHRVVGGGFVGVWRRKRNRTKTTSAGATHSEDSTDNNESK